MKNNTKYCTYSNFRTKSVHKQKGLSLIEVSIVTAIVLLLAIIAIPAVGSYVVENKVPKVGEELARFALHTQINAQPGSSLPYADINTGVLAGMVEDSTIFAVTRSGSTTRVLHGLGNDGAVEVGPSSSGAGFTITLDKVNHAACPSLASVLQKISDQIIISSMASGDTTVKSDSISYNALQAESSCTKGDLNTFIFTIS